MCHISIANKGCQTKIIVRTGTQNILDDTTAFLEQEER